MTVVPDFDEGSAAVSVLGDHWQTSGAWESRDKFRDIASVLRARIMATMAGAETEIVCLGHCRGGDGEDQYWIAAMMQEIAIPGGDQQSYDSRLRAKTQSLVRRHRHKIEHLAGLLMERRTIPGRNLEPL